MKSEAGVFNKHYTEISLIGPDLGPGRSLGCGCLGQTNARGSRSDRGLVSEMGPVVATVKTARVRTNSDIYDSAMNGSNYDSVVGDSLEFAGI